jgi:hypothetical protein
VELNNREVALLVWIAIAIAWMISQSDMRGSLWALIKAFFKPMILITVIGYFAWTAGLVYLATRDGLWSWELIGDAVIWIGASFALLFHSEDGHFLRRKAAVALRATILVEVFVNLVVFPLILELALVPFLTFLALLSAFSGLKPEWEPVGKLVDTLLTWIGIGLLAYVGMKLAEDPGQIDRTTALRFLLPVWLSLGILPYIYLVALYAGYDGAFRRINFNSEDRSTRLRAKWILIKRCRLRAARLGEFRGPWLRGCAQP